MSKCCELRNNCFLLTFLGSLRCARSIFDFGISTSALCINSSTFSSAFSCVSSFLHGFFRQVLQLWFIASCWNSSLLHFYRIDCWTDKLLFCPSLKRSWRKVTVGDSVFMPFSSSLTISLTLFLIIFCKLDFIWSMRTNWNSSSFVSITALYSLVLQVLSLEIK